MTAIIAQSYKPTTFAVTYIKLLILGNSQAISSEIVRTFITDSLSDMVTNPKSISPSPSISRAAMS